MSTTATTQFTVGQTVQARSAADHECVWTFTVESRTTKFATFRQTDTGETFRVGVKVSSDGAEWAMPFGRYSMAPVVRADREEV